MRELECAGEVASWEIIEEEPLTEYGQAFEETDVGCSKHEEGCDSFQWKTSPEDGFLPRALHAESKPHV